MVRTHDAHRTLDSRIARVPGGLARPSLNGQPEPARPSLPGVRAVGVDPGAHTGLVVLETGPTGGLQGSRWIEHVTLDRPGLSRKRQWTWQAELELHRLIALFMDRHGPELVVLEEPWDISDGWGIGGRRVGTGFRLGAAWALALAACPANALVECYPVRRRKARKGSRDGWMNGKAWGLRVAAQLAQVEGAPYWDDLSDHERAAFGVLAHHLT
jgi:hypothetical protein